jgi:hypothetical protein
MANGRSMMLYQNLYQQMIQFIVEMDKQGLHLRCTKLDQINQIILYEFTVGGVPGHFTQEQIRRLDKLKAFW